MCVLLYRARLDGSELCPVLHGTPIKGPRGSSLVTHEFGSKIELYWNDADKIRQKGKFDKQL